MLSNRVSCTGVPCDVAEVVDPHCTILAVICLLRVVCSWLCSVTSRLPVIGTTTAKGKFMHDARGLEYCTYLQLVR
mgnify:CR=1 FL=1